MAGDFRETIIGCAAAHCRFNVQTQVEPTCRLKMVAIDETGRCLMAEGRPVVQKPQQQPVAGHFENGMWMP